MNDLKSIVQEYAQKIQPEHRYASFDYCYNYFLTTDDLTEDIEKSCLTLGYYLASWGMLRGSSFLLQKSAKYFQSTIEYIVTLDKDVWEIDVDNYNNQTIERIIGIYNEIKSRLILNGSSDLTLITKVMLGVFGFIPAFDNFFCSTFRSIYKGKCGFRRVNFNSLNRIKDFYDENREVINKFSNEIFTIDFKTGLKTKIKYPKAKIIDMYGFTVGMKNR